MFTITIHNDSNPELVVRIGTITTDAHGVTCWFGELYGVDSGRLRYEEFYYSHPDKLACVASIGAAMLNYYIASVIDASK